MACRSATAMSTCCETRCRWTRSIPAACTSARPAARSTPPPTPGTPGSRSFATFPRFSPSRSRPCDDPGGAPASPAHPREGLRRSPARHVPGPPTPRAVLDALEARYPVLRGTSRDHVTHERRAFIRFFACSEDLSHDSADTLLPAPVAQGAEPFIILGAIAGG